VQFYCVGKRPLTALRRANVSVARAYPAVASIRGLTRLLLTLADDVLEDYLTGGFSSLQIVSARFDGVGAFTARTTQILPVASTRTVRRLAATPYSSATRLAEAAVREYLYSTLYELLLDALAAEHGMRLVATESAGEWLDTRVQTLQRQLASARRESSTQEVLDVAGGARQRRTKAAV
jgi:F-type H+-transporting ATPase subunit gamma